MKITKPDFKIIFNKIINNSNDKNMQILQKLSNNSNSGDYQIDNLVNTYSSEYISKIMNKILKNSQIGGETSEESKKNTSILDLTETSIEPPKFINIIDVIGGADDKVSTQTNNSFYNKLSTFLTRDNTKSNSSVTSSELSRIQSSETGVPPRSTYKPWKLRFNPSKVNSETSPLESMQSRPLSPTSSERSQSPVNSETSPLESMQSRLLSPTSSEPNQSKWSLFRSRSSSPVNSETSSLESMQIRSLSPTSSEPRQSQVNSETSPLNTIQTRSLSPTSSEPQSKWSLLRSRLRQKSPVKMQSRSLSPTSSESNYFIQSDNNNVDKLLKEKDDEIQRLKNMLAQIKK